MKLFKISIKTCNSDTFFALTFKFSASKGKILLATGT